MPRRNGTSPQDHTQPAYPESRRIGERDADDRQDAPRSGSPGGAAKAVLLCAQDGRFGLARMFLDDYRRRYPEADDLPRSARDAALDRLLERAHADEPIPAATLDNLIRELEADAQAGQWMTWADVQALPALSWLVDGLLPVGGVSLLIGHPKAGKSTLSRVLAAEVLGHGFGRFLGRDVCDNGPVAVYCPDEAPQMMREHMVGILPADARDLHVVQGGDLESLRAGVEETGCKLLIVDTLGRLFAGARFPDGDAYMAWQTHLDAVRRLAGQTGCHVMLLHHARKSGGDRSLAVLGSAAIAGSADTVISMTVEERDAGGYDRFIASTNRAGVEVPRHRLILAGDGWLTVEPPATERGDRTDPSAVVKAEVRAMREAGHSFGQIAEALGISKNMAYRWSK